MSTFTATTTAEAIVTAPRQAVWDVLSDPDLVAQLTPFLRRITASGEHWRWEMSGLSVLGLDVAPSFTERMTFDHPERIEFRHDPPAGVKERSGVEGWYHMREVAESDGGGTFLATSLAITLDLPLPRVSSSAVTSAMRGVMGQMGDRFAANLLQHLGAEERPIR